MSDLNSRFQQALVDVKALPERPGNLQLLRLYALYKQGSEGDAHGDRPGMSDIVGRYKFDAWAAMQGTPQVEAQEKYIEAVEALKRGDSL